MSRPNDPYSNIAPVLPVAMPAPPLDQEHCDICRCSKAGSSGCWFLLHAIVVADVGLRGSRARQGRRREQIRILRIGMPYLWETHRRICYYCGRLTRVYDNRLPDGRRNWPDQRTKDHVVPRSRGGTSVYANRVTCCFSCNQLKGSRDHDEFLDDLLAANGHIVLSSATSL